MHPREVGDVERGHSNATLGRLVKLASALSVSLSSLVSVPPVPDPWIMRTFDPDADR